jgi:hypothetical protein
MTIGRNNQPSTEELLASIRRIVAESQIAPSDTTDIGRAAAPVPLAIDSEPDDFELPAMFRKERENALAREVGFVERLTQAIRGEPAQAQHLVGPLPTDATASLEGSSSNAFAKFSHMPHEWRAEPDASGAMERDSGPVSAESLSVAEPVLPAPSGEMRRVMAPCKDTLMARMGQPVDAPSLRVKPRSPSAHVREAEDFY